jgi:ATPase family associated with various cellular activities (AAA)
MSDCDDILVLGKRIGQSIIGQEAMVERLPRCRACSSHRISCPPTSRALPDLFMVMATQNPIEQEGTYPLPEAQLDRFLTHVEVGYPDETSEAAIMRLVRDEEIETKGKSAKPNEKLDPKAVFDARKEVSSVTVAKPVEDYNGWHSCSPPVIRRSLTRIWPNGCRSA